MAFVYDTRKVDFMNIAGEIVLPKSLKIAKELQFARTPFMVAFQSGWFKFSLCTVHIYYGADSGRKLERRIREIDHLAKFMGRRAKKSQKNMILCGDFNIKSPDDATMKALLKNGFEVPGELRHTTNLLRDKYYDQIAFMIRENELNLGDSTPNAGVFNFYDHVYQNNDWNTYAESYGKVGKWSAQTTAEARQKYFKKWRTWQMSDHYPLWVELKINFADAYLEGIE